MGQTMASQNSWDVAGGSILIEEAGGLMTDIDGSPYSLSTRAIIGSNKLVSVKRSSLSATGTFLEFRIGVFPLDLSKCR